jgi:hypothetical protein
MFAARAIGRDVMSDPIGTSVGTAVICLADKGHEHLVQFYERGHRNRTLADYDSEAGDLAHALDLQAPEPL